MSTSARDAPTITGARRLALEAAAVGLLATVFSAWLSHRGDFIGNVTDGAVYLVLADLMSPYRAADFAPGFVLLDDFPFPPLYPFVLALLGGGSEAPHASYAAGAAMLGCATAAVHAWVRTQACGPLVAGTIAGLFLLLPSTLLLALGIHSEPLYAALVFAGFALLARARARAGAMLVGASALARTAGVSAVAAVIAHWLRTGGRRHGWQVPLLAVLPGALWVVFRAFAGARAGYLDQIRQDTLGATLAALLAQFEINLAALWYGLVTSVDLGGGPHTRALLVALALLAVAGFWPRLRRGEVDALYVAFYLAMIVLWPYPNHMRRFLQVLWPLLLFYAHRGLVGVSAVAAGKVSRRLPVAAGALAFALAGWPSSASIIGQIWAAGDGALAARVRSPQWYRFASPVEALAKLDRVDDIMEALRDIDEHVPPTACVSSAVHPYVPMYARRRARAPAGLSRSDAELDAGLAECPYVFMVAAAPWPPSDYSPMYPHARVADRLEVIEVTLWDRDADSGPVLTMLAKLRPAGAAPAASARR